MFPSAQFKERIFHQFFPPPRFLEVPVVGLAISDNAISAIELVRNKGAFAVGRFGRRVLPPGILSLGYIHNKDAVIEELRKLKDSLKLDFVNASLSEEKAYLFRTKIPRVPQKEIRGVLEFKLEENVPIPASDAIFDYTVITQAGHDTSDHLDVGVTVLPKKVVDTYVEVLDAVNITPLSFETEAQAISRAIIGRGDEDTYLVVNIGETKTGLFIVSDEVVHFTSSIAIGGADITKAIAKHLSVSVEEAANIKQKHTVFKSKKNLDLFLLLMNAVSVLKDEVRKLSVYWNTHGDAPGEIGKKISQIILCGHDSGLTGFAEYLSQVLQSKVEAGNVWRNAFSFEEYIPPILFDESLDYAAAVGLALPKGH